MSSVGRLSLTEALDLYIRRWKRSFDSYKTRRKVLLALLLVTAVTLYIGSGVIRWLFYSSSHAFIDFEKTTLEEQLRPFKIEEDSFNTFITRSWVRSDHDIHVDSSGHFLHTKHFHPFVGNGKIGLDIDDSDSAIYIHGRRGLEQQLPFHPLISINALPGKTESVSVVRIVEGLVHRVTAFSYVTNTATIFETIYAHRLISSLIVQEFRINNPSDVPLILTIRRGGWKGKPSIKTSSFSVKGNIQYTVTEGDVRYYESGSLLNTFVIAAPLLPETLEVPARNMKTFVFRTFVNYTNPLSPTRASLAMNDLRNSIQESTRKVHEILSTSLIRYHTEAWHNLWKVGFGISLSRAEGVLNGDDINATLYYILSHRSSFPSDVNIVTPIDVDDSRMTYLLNHPDRCYAGDVPTLQAQNLWGPLDSSTAVLKIVSLWLLTMEKNGCNNLMNAGAEGTMQAIILSFVGMQFHQNHLEMGIHPKELHRDYFIRRVRYSNTTTVNVTMKVGEDYKASIFVTLDKHLSSRGDFYACDAGCLDSPIRITTEHESQLPVKLTDPPTSILYITSDKQHIDELKHTIHVKEVAVAPPHETHLIALHRHGHRLGGLPTVFWAAIIVLIVIFHAFLIKLIYNEYLSGSSSSSTSFSYIGYSRLRRAV